MKMQVQVYNNTFKIKLTQLHCKTIFYAKIQLCPNIPTAKVSALSLLFVLPPSSLLVAGTMSRMSMSLGYLLNWKGSCQPGSHSMVSIKEPASLYKLRLSDEENLFSTCMKQYYSFLYDEIAMEKFRILKNQSENHYLLEIFPAEPNQDENIWRAQFKHKFESN